MLRKFTFIWLVLLIFSKAAIAGYYQASPGNFQFNLSGGGCSVTTCYVTNISIQLGSKSNVTISFNLRLSNSGETHFYSSSSGIFGGNVNATFAQSGFGEVCNTSTGSGTTYFIPSISGGSFGGSQINASLRIQAVGRRPGGSGDIGVSFNFIRQGSSNQLIPSGLTGSSICSNSSLSAFVDVESFMNPVIIKFNNQTVQTIETSNSFTVSQSSISFNPANYGAGDGGVYKLRVEYNDGANSAIERDITVYTPFGNTNAITFEASPNISCYGQPVTLSVKNVSGSSINYDWSNSASTTVPSVFVSNPQSGNYSVGLSKGPDRVCYFKTNDYNIPVLADFSANIAAIKTRVCDGESIQLIASPSDGNSYSYSWSNGGNGSDTWVSKNDNYSVTITPKIGNCPGKTSNIINNLTFDKKITGETITIPSGKTKAILCANESALVLTAKADDQTNMGYQWSGPKTGNTQTLSVNTTGEYSLVLTRGTCVSTVKKIYVIGNVVPRITPEPADLRICRGQAIKFTTIPTDKGNFSYEWYNGTGTALMAGKTEPTLDATEPGTYRLLLKPVGAGCTQFNEAKAIVAVDENIKGALNYTGSAVICNTQQGLDLIASGTGANISYKWSTGATTAKINVKTAGIYKVTMTRGKCVEEQSVSTQVKDLEARIATIDKNPTGVTDTGIIICTGTNYQPYELKATSNFTAATFLWKKDNANAPNATTAATYQPTSAGRYTAYAEVKELGCISKAPSNVFVVTAPTNFAVNVTPLNPPAICEGTSITLTATPTYQSNLIKYDWAGTTIKTNTLSSKAEGNYTVNISQEGCKASNSSQVTTKPSKPTIAIVDENLLVSTTSTDSNYEWFFKPLPVSANPADYNLNSPVGRNQQYLVNGVSNFGAYIVRANRNGCGRIFSDPFAVNSVVLSTSDPSTQVFTIYPNPITKTFNIHDELAARKTIELRRLDGTLIKVWQSEEKNTTLNIEDFQAGGYLLKIQSQNKSITKKILKI